MFDPDGGYDEPLGTLAETLAEEGPPGVQMALRSQVTTLPRRVMEKLGLGREWLDSEEAKKILFGEELNYDG